MGITKESLEIERAGYERRGLPDRVAEVDAAIAALPADEKVPFDPEAPDNGGTNPAVLIAALEAKKAEADAAAAEAAAEAEAAAVVVESTDDVPADVEHAIEPKPSRRKSG